MKKIYNLLITLLLVKIITPKQDLTHCQNGKRILIRENKTNKTFSCIDCPEGEYTLYNEKTNKLECEKCPTGSSNYKNDIIINNFLSENLITKYSFESFCSIQNDICPKWEQNYFSIKVTNINSLSYKSYFSINQYFMNNGELNIKYINYNGGLDKIFNVYINGILSFTDDSNDNVLKSKIFEIKKGVNTFIFEYLVNEELKSKNLNVNNESFIEIFEIVFKNAEISALKCDKYEVIEKLSNNILNNCEYDVSKCDIRNDYCTYRFYTEIKNEYCIKQLDSFYQEIEYKKIDNAKCTELSTPSSQDDLCEHCSFGQFTKLLNDGDSKICNYCQNNSYNPNEINDEFSCEGLCQIENGEKQLFKILYINNFDNPSNFKIENIEIIQPIGYTTIKYEKFNEKINTIFFIEIDSVTLKLIDPNDSDINSSYLSFSIPLIYGEHSLNIKGSNLKLNKITIKGSSEGGNYKCVDKINMNEEVNCKSNDEYYSILQNKCLNCSLGTFIDKNKKCIIYNQFINNIYTLDNNDLNINIFSKNYELDDKNIKYYLNINPANPLIYMKNNTIYLDDNNNDYIDNIDIIGKELKNIKIVKGLKERGIILSFISEKNNSYIYIKCNPNISEDINTKIYLKNKTDIKDNDEIIANYFFVIESNTSCPYCLSSEVNFEENNNNKCINGKKKAIVSSIKNNSLCIIKKFDEKESSKLEDNNILLNKNTSDIEEQMILNSFEINEEIPVKYEKEKDEIIISYDNEISCDEKNNNQKLYIVLLILLCFVGFILFGLIAVVIWKMIDNRKKHNISLKSGEKMNEMSVINFNT